MSLLYLLISLTLLYLSKQLLVIQITRFIKKGGGGNKAVVILWSIIFLPGTIIHELSHFFMAMVVGAQTGKIEIFPKNLDDDNETYALGSVQTQKLNILQGALVGLAPLITGLLLVGWLSGLVVSYYHQSNYLNLILTGYLFFTVINSMFPSRSDIRHVVPATFAIIAFLLLILLSGAKLDFGLDNLDVSLISPLQNSIAFAFLANSTIGLTILFFKKLLFK